MLRRHQVICGVLEAILFGVLFFSGCGKKGDPIPPRLMLPPTIAGLTAESIAEGMELRWSASGPIVGIDHFRIVRGETTSEQACPGCPQEYRPLATPKVADQVLLRTREGTFRYLDGAVTADRFYSYRVSACDSKGHCGEPSAPANRLREKR